jgi:hypothetical protein
MSRWARRRLSMLMVTSVCVAVTAVAAAAVRSHVLGCDW